MALEIIFCHPTINSLGFWVFRGQDTEDTAWWIVGRDYTAAATVYDVFKMEALHIEMGWIIITIHVSKI